MTVIRTSSNNGDTESPLPPSKRLKIDDQPALVRRHPLGVRPAGNAFTSKINLMSSCGPFGKLSDELLLQFLEILQIPHLLRLGSTCRALHAFTRSEELWRALFVESSPRAFAWRGTWRSTYLAQPSTQEPKINCSNLFSDALHRPFYCAHVPLGRYADNIPEKNAIARLSTLSPEQFSLEWFSKPFILTSAVEQWPIYKPWTIDHLVEKYGNVDFRAESVDWPLNTYAEYMRSNHDESPLYLFDRAFVEKMCLNQSPTTPDFWPPPCLGEDVLSVLGAQRPDHRWIIIGPERSGSTFHKDPNATSAWNAVIRGSKYWIMFPSSPSIPPPPGVYVSEDQSEVTSPLSIAEWLLAFHAEARATPGCREGVCNAGEMVHVPSGWYHLVLNLEPSIAITQNFVPRSRVGAVLHFLRDQKQSMSGFGNDVEDPFDLFVHRLREEDPELLEQGLRELQTLSRGAKGKWEMITKGDGDEDEVDAGGFSFGFGGDEEEVDVP